MDGIWWLLLFLGPLLLIQRRLNFEIQAVLLLLTRRFEITLAIFSLLFFPGVLLHEISHFIAALILGVPTGRFSLVPIPMQDGRLRLGFVETAKTDVIRDAIIGAAPLIFGGIFVAYAGSVRMGLLFLWESIRQGETVLALEYLTNLPEKPDFWLWFYLMVAVSSTMLPSSSDRRAWPAVGLVVALLLGLSLVAGAGPWLLDNFATPLNNGLRSISLVFGVSLLVQASLLIPMWGLRHLLISLTGLEVK